jgi:hypothetical protein
LAKGVRGEFPSKGEAMTHITRCAIVGLVALVLAQALWAGSPIRKNGSIVADLDGKYLRQNGSIIAEFDGKYLRVSGSIVAEHDGKNVRKNGSIVAEIDGTYIRKNGSIIWEIEENGTVRKNGSIFYTVDGFTGSEEMRWRVAAYLLFFAT